MDTVHADTDGINLRISASTSRSRSTRADSVRCGIRSARTMGRPTWAAVSPGGRADRSDPVSVAASSDESHDQRCERSISAAKKTEAYFRISLASRRLQNSLSISLIRSCPAVVTPGVLSASIRACRVQVRSDSTPPPASGR
uniref:Uncharacterized protein n=1 Tax=Rhodococcus sp. NS1 TaxID=402236 RepID=A0A097SQV6_9NOCA|nr:hypothetical protein LRS1606.468 [Rhodococcus sp. NS1]